MGVPLFGEVAGAGSGGQGFGRGRAPAGRFGEAEAGGGMVKVAMNGKGVVTMIKINPDAVDKDDVEALEDLLMAAINSAVKKKDDATQESISGITGGMKIPGLM